VNGTTRSAVVLISGNGSNLQALIDATAGGELPLEISAVISNRAAAYGLQRAAAACLPQRVLEHTTFAARARFDRALADLIDGFAPDYILLAGFMRILSAEFVARYTGRLLNIHPSLLPAYPGLDTHRRVLENGEREHGASIHYVNDQVDGGPVVLQVAVPVARDDTPETLAARVLAQEHRLYPEALRRIATGRVRLENGRVLHDGSVLETPPRLDPAP
jgi:phosphoribosylglycinamide formyltransferase-1